MIAALNPVISGWSLYYRTCVAKRTFNKLDALLHGQLMGWTAHRHPQRGYRWRYQRYWRQEGTRRVFSDGEHPLRSHAATHKHHIKYAGQKSVRRGWGLLGRTFGAQPTQPARVSRLVQQQQGRCGNCGLPLTTEDVLEIHNRDGNHRNDGATNLVILHAHCHDQSHAGLALTRPHVLRSRMRRKSQVRFCSGGGVGDHPTDRNQLTAPARLRGCRKSRRRGRS